MYRLMKSEKFHLHSVVSGTLSSYRQVQVHQFQQFGAALTACEVYNDKSELRHYILNELGKEYYNGAWID